MDHDASADLRPVRRRLRRWAIALAGWFVIALGIVLIPLPGPGTLVVLAGLTLLGREFPRAQRIARRLRATVLRDGGGGGRSQEAGDGRPPR